MLYWNNNNSSNSGETTDLTSTLLITSSPLKINMFLEKKSQSNNRTYVTNVLFVFRGRLSMQKRR